MNRELTNIIFITSCIVLTVSIFWFAYSSLSIRLDESQSIWQTANDLDLLLESLSRNVHVPLYHIVMHYWQIAFGNDIIVTRALSLGFFVALIPLFFYGLRSIYNKQIAYLATMLLVVSPFIHWFSSETRMYTMVLLLTVVSQFTFLHLMRTNRSEYWLLYTVVAILGMYTHYFFNLVLLSQIIFFFTFRTTHFTASHLKNFLTAGCLALAAFIPWVYAVIQGAGTDADPQLVAPSSVDFFNLFANFLFGFQIDLVNSYILSFWPLLFVLMIFGLKRSNPFSAETTFFLISAFVPLFVAFAASYVLQPLFLSRYLIVSLPAIVILIALSINHFSFDFRNKLLTTICAACLIASFTQWQSPNTPVKEDFRSAVAFMNENTTPQDTVFVSAPFLIYPTFYYYSGPAAVRTLPDWDRHGGDALDSSMNVEKIETSIKNHHHTDGNLFVLLGYDQGDELILRNYLAENYTTIEHLTLSPDLELLVLSNSPV